VIRETSLAKVGSRLHCGLSIVKPVVVTVGGKRQLPPDRTRLLELAHTGALIPAEASAREISAIERGNSIVGPGIPISIRDIHVVHDGAATSVTAIKTIPAAPVPRVKPLVGR